MKKLLPPIALVFACALFFLRRAQLAAFDANGLLPDGSTVSLALYLVCTLAAALVLIVCLREKGPGYGVPAGKNQLRGVLVILAALALLGSYLPPDFQGGVKNVVPVLAFAAACAMAVEGVYHLSGNTGSLLGGCILPVYLAALLISDYRGWSHNPLVADFCFPLLFLVSAMLASYHLAAFRVGRGKRRTTAFFVGCALLFAGPVLAGGGWRSVLRALAVCIYLIAEFFPYLDEPEPLPEPEPAAAEEPAAAGETAEADAPDAFDIPEEIPEAEELPEAAEDPAVTEISEPAEEAAAEIPQAGEEIAPEL